MGNKDCRARPLSKTVDLAVPAFERLLLQSNSVYQLFRPNSLAIDRAPSSHDSGRNRSFAPEACSRLCLGILPGSSFSRFQFCL